MVLPPGSRIQTANLIYILDVTSEIRFPVPKAHVMAAPLPLEAQPMLVLQASADQPGFDLCVALSRLPADGVAVEQLSTGVLRVCGDAALTPAPYRIRLQPLLASFFPGDRLRISIAAAAWPAIGINSGDPLIACGAPSPQHRVVSMTLHLAGSQLELIPLTSGKLVCN